MAKQKPIRANLTNVRTQNVTKEYIMHIEDKAYILGMTIIALTIIYLSWGFDAPLGNFAICFGGCLLGHVLTIMLDDTTNEKEET